MKFSQFPQAIKDKVRQHIEEQGDLYDESVLDMQPSAGQGGGGFNWGMTSEGNRFWDSVMLRHNFDLFFEKYPEESETISIPDNIKVGDQFRVTALKEKDLEYLQALGLKPNDTVTLHKNDGSECPLFRTENDITAIYWHLLEPLTNVEKKGKQTQEEYVPGYARRAVERW